MTQNINQSLDRNLDQSLSSDSFKTLTLVLYILYILAIFSAGILAIVALIINYVKRDDVQGTIYASHFRWQIRTFWWYLFWNIILFVPFLFLLFTGDNENAFLGVAFGAGTFALAVMFISWVWIVYRAIRGIIALNENKAMYLDSH